MWGHDGGHISGLSKAFKIKTGYREKKIKFGVEVPRDTKEAYFLDLKNRNTLWQEAIAKELRQLNDFKTFRALERDEDPPKGYSRIPYHIVYVVKRDDRRKARLVANNNWLDEDKDNNCSGVVSTELMRIGFLIASLNSLKVCAGDISNAYLFAQAKEKVYIKAGKEFGPELEGRILIIDKALYCLPFSGLQFHQDLAVTLKDMGFVPSKVASDFWYLDRGDHYEYMACYVDVIMVYCKKLDEVIKEIEKIYSLKGVGEPEYYLGGNVITLNPNEWAKAKVETELSAETYIKNIIPKLVKLVRKEEGHTNFKGYPTPMSSTYHPQVDQTDLLSKDEISVYRSIIGSLNWAIMLGIFDIYYAMDVLSCYNMKPHKGHMQAAQCILGYLQHHDKGRIIIDQSYPNLEDFKFRYNAQWKDIYGDNAEKIPDPMPDPKGKPIMITVYVDASHAQDLVTRRSVTGIF